MKYISTYFLFFLLLACKNNPKTPVVEKDSIAVTSVDSLPQDSKEEEEGECYDAFFKASAPIDSNKIILINDDGKQLKLPAFIDYQTLNREYLNIALKDVDKDSVQELWIKDYSGGAHCCDEWYVYLPQKNGRFKQAAFLFGGDACVDDSVFTFSFDQSLGYFKSCFACGYDDTKSGFQTMRSINLRYNKGKFEVIPYSAKEEEQLIKNLQLLKAAASAKPESLRDIKKEFAMTFAVYHYNHKKDLKQTRKMFDSYYTIKDKALIWKEFMDYIKDMPQFNGI